jgi:hypothetical protein
MLTPRQRETHGLIHRTLGDAMAQRYKDWCDVVGGTVRLRVPGPVIGHLAREFESMLRAALKTPFEVGTQLPQDVQKKLDAAKTTLDGLAYDEAKVRNAVAKLRPDTHSDEIDAICQRIGLPVDGEVNRAWKDLQSQAGRAHWRSYWESSSVEGHATTIDRFELVMREVLAALERRYDAFFQQIDRLCAVADPNQAAKTFAKDIPLSQILQQRFYMGAPISVRWITALRAHKLFTNRQLQFDSESNESQQTNVPWWQRIYLTKAAASEEPAVRRKASEIIRELASTDDIAILDSCAHAVTALPADQAAPFADTFVSWLKGQVAWPISSQAAEFVKNMSAANMAEPAFLVARALFGFDKDKDGRTTARFDSGMYAHHVKLAGPQLTRLNAPLAFDLFIELLVKSLEFRGLIDPDGGHDHSTSGYGSLIGTGPTGYEEPDALVEVANEAAIEACVDSSEARLVIARLRAFGVRLMDRIALDLALRNVTQVPDVADEMLLDPRLMDGYWCRSQYASLARARLPAAAPDLVDAVLKLANSIPDRFEENWLANRRAMGQPEPTEKDIADYRAATVLDVLFQFKDVLPAEVRNDLDKSANQYGIESHVATGVSASSPAALDGKFLPFPAGSTGALMDEAKAHPDAFFVEGRLTEIPTNNIWIVFDSLKDAQNRGVPLVWEPIFSWIDSVLPKGNQWVQPDAARELRAALVAALQLIAANLERQDSAKTPLPYMRLATLVVRLWEFPPDAPASEFPWPEADPGGASFRTVAGLSLLIGFRLAFLEDEAASGDAGFTSAKFAPLVFERMATLVADPNPAGDLCRGQIGMWFSNLLERAPEWTVQQMPALFGDASPADARPAWYGYVHRAGTSAAAAHALEPHYRAAIERVGEDEPADWGDLRPSYQIGFRLIRDFMLGYIDIDETGLLSNFLGRASDELRARLIWIVWRWVGGPDVEPDIIGRGIRFAEARLAVAEAANQVDDLKKEFNRFSTWLEAPRLDTVWLLEIVGRIADLGLVGVGIFSIFRWLERICEDHPDAALETASRVVLRYGADGLPVYGSTGQIRTVLKTALTRGSPATIKRAVELANALEVRGITGMYDHVSALLSRPSGEHESP